MAVDSASPPYNARASEIAVLPAQTAVDMAVAVPLVTLLTTAIESALPPANAWASEIAVFRVRLLLMWL